MAFNFFFATIVIFCNNVLCMFFVISIKLFFILNDIITIFNLSFFYALNIFIDKLKKNSVYYFIIIKFFIGIRQKN